MKNTLLKNTLFLIVVAAVTVIGVAPPASAQYREVRIVRDWDDWRRPPWVRHHVRWGECRDVTERRYRPNGTVVVRRIHRCD